MVVEQLSKLWVGGKYSAPQGFLQVDISLSALPVVLLFVSE